MGKESKSKTSDNDGMYHGQHISEDCWFAVIDTEHNSIVHVDGFIGYVRDYLEHEILHTELENWFGRNPEHKGSEVPECVLDELEKRFIIVSCNISIPANAEVWRSYE